MRGDPTYRIFDELSSYRFGVTQPGRLAFFFENLLFQIDMICLDVRSSCTCYRIGALEGVFPFPRGCMSGEALPKN